LKDCQRIVLFTTQRKPLVVTRLSPVSFAFMTRHERQHGRYGFVPVLRYF